MIENASINPIVERIAEQATASQAGVPPKAADASDAARFLDALNGDQQPAPPEPPAAPEAGEASPATPADPSPGDDIRQVVERFRAGIRADYQSALEKAQTSMPNQFKSQLGDNILQTLQKMRADYQSVIEKAEGLAAAGNPSIPNLLQTQMDLTRVSTQVDLTAKVVGKTTQGIETLIKSQ